MIGVSSWGGPVFWRAIAAFFVFHRVNRVSRSVDYLAAAPARRTQACDPVKASRQLSKQLPRIVGDCEALFAAAGDSKN